VLMVWYKVLGVQDIVMETIAGTERYSPGEFYLCFMYVLHV